MKFVHNRIIFICIFLVSISLSGQTFEIKNDTLHFTSPQIVVTANRYEKMIMETHLPVQIVSARSIWQFGRTTAGEMITVNPGISMVETGPWSQKAVIRGLAGSQVLTLVDGLRLEVLRSYGNHAPLIDADLIDRVEIIRGPASLLYGSDAIGGVINYITQKPEYGNKNFQLNGSFGLQSSSVNKQFGQNFTLTGSSRQWSFLISAQNRKADNIQTPIGELKNSGFEGYGLNASIGFRPDPKHNFLLSGQLQRFSNVGIPVNRFAEKAQFDHYNRDLTVFQYKFQNSNAKLAQIETKFYYQKGERVFNALLRNIPKGPFFVENKLNAHRFANTFGGNIQTRFLLAKNHLMIAGIDGFATSDDTKRTADAKITNAGGTVIKNPPPNFTPPTPVARRSGIGIFLENEITPLARFTLLMGARYDINTTHADGTTGTLIETDRDENNNDWSGNFGFLYRLNSTVRLTANIGKAFSSPTLQQRYFKGTAQIGYLEGNPDLASEKSLNLDFSLKWHKKHLNGEVSIFRNQISNFIVLSPTTTKADSFLYDNVGKALLKGSEFKVNINLLPCLTGTITASYVIGENITTNQPLPKMPPFQGQLSLNYQDRAGNFHAGLNTIFVSQQERVDKNEAETPAYQLVNFSSGINLTKIWRFGMPVFLTLNIKNIFNVNYRNHLSTVTWQSAPGRNIQLGIKGLF